MAEVGKSTRRARKPGLALVVLALAVLVLGLSAAGAQAAERTWTGEAGSNAWSNPANWDDGLTVPQAGDELVFPDMDGWEYALNDLTPGMEVEKITFVGSLSSYAISGNAIALGDGGIMCSCTSGNTSFALAMAFPSTRNIVVSASSQILELYGVMSGSGGLTTSGQGTVWIGALNTYAGDTLVSSGTLQIRAQNGLPYGAGKGDVTVGGLGTLDAYRDFAINGLWGSGTVTCNGGTPGRVLTVGNNDASSTFSGQLVDGLKVLRLTKTGLGTLELDGVSAYTGATSVSAGTLEVNGSTGSGTATVASGATLSGVGTVGGTVNVSGTISPGSAPSSTATLYTGAESWNADGQYAFELGDAGPPLGSGTAGGATGWDLLSSSGAITLNSTVADPFTVKVTTVSAPGTPGACANFDNTQSYSWKIAGGSITSFDITKTYLDPTGFSPALPSGSHLYLTSKDDGVYLNYDPPGSAVVVKSFAARVRASGKVVIVWKTAMQSNTAGFFLQRRNPVTKTWRRVNRTLVPAVWNASGGATYRVVDPLARNGRRSTYRLREVLIGGGSALYGPYGVVPQRL